MGGELDPATLLTIIRVQEAINDADASGRAVMQIVADQACQATGAPGAVIELAEGDDMVYTVTSGSLDGTEGVRLARGGSLSGEAVGTGKVLISSDTETDERVDREACRRVGARSMIVVPLIAGDRVQGVLKVISGQPHAFGEDNVNLLEHLAHFIARALQRADVRPVESEARERLEFEDCLSRAIAEGRLVAYAQPIVDARTGEVVEEELLVRMIGSDGQVLVPDGFLPQARRFGLMPSIDRFMVARGIELARAGRRVAVNLSGNSINDTAASAAIIEQLRQAGDAAHRMSFEITEHAALASTELAERFSEDMRGLGCRLALDDFGTGFGSLTELRGMTLHTLKIDRSFVSGLLRSPHDESIVRAIVGIAREFGLRTTAEGVEDAETRARLVELGVDQIQGYLIGHPAPV